MVTVTSSLSIVGDIELVVFSPAIRFCGFGFPLKYRFTIVIKALELHLAANVLSNVLAHTNHLPDRWVYGVFQLRKFFGHRLDFLSFAGRCLQLLFQPFHRVVPGSKKNWTAMLFYVKRFFKSCVLLWLLVKISILFSIQFH